MENGWGDQVRTIDFLLGLIGFSSEEGRKTLGKGQSLTMKVKGRLLYRRDFGKRRKGEAELYKKSLISDRGRDSEIISS